MHGYPRPQLVRPHWLSLNGPWEFAFDREACWRSPADVAWARTIQVPFAPETRASGIDDPTYSRACWYRRRCDPRPLGAAPGDHVVLHFGAVDYVARVWVDERFAGGHEGGYTPFAIDVSDAVAQGEAFEVVVCAYDDPLELAKPRGKQDWMPDPHAIWYPRTSGIWQTVWLERVPRVSVGNVRWTSSLERWDIGLSARIDGPVADGTRLRVRLGVGTLLLSDDTYSVVHGEVSRRIALADPGIDDHRNELLWSPRSPTLIEATLTLLAPDGATLDTVRSYTALRSIGVQGDRVVLNGRPLQLRMVLDQGYWPGSGLTAPDDHAFRRDVELAKAMGFNGVRKHQKIEDPRFLYWADRLGLLVWEEMPSAYRFTEQAIQRLTREWTEAMLRDASHPCIVAWVPFNESWGVPNLPEIPAERHFVQALYHLTRTLDPTRPVIGNDGWESVATDIIGIHDYDEDLDRLAHRYAAEDEIPHLFRRERPGGRLLTLEGHEHRGQPVVLSEFGGVALAPPGVTVWAHARVPDVATFERHYVQLLDVVRTRTMLAGFCYTQFADTYQEANGLLTAEREPKFPLERIARGTRGPESGREAAFELEWRARLAAFRRQHDIADPKEEGDAPDAG